VRLLFLFLAALLIGGPTTPADLPVVVANDNRTPAGVLENGVLTIRLVVTNARWYPENPGGSFTDVPVFAEEGKAPQIPGPLIRVPQGTEIRATIRNALLDSTVTLRGFQSRPAEGRDSVVLDPGGSAEVTFNADAAGTYLYWARSSRKGGETEQLAGAIVVDAPGARTDDRIFVINIWSMSIDSTAFRNALAINGKSWPYTERVETTVGDTVRWRVLNGSVRNHPMHLHGFFYDISSRGDGLLDSVYTDEQHRMVVTETLRGRHTMALTWVPEQPGNWLFHCHLSFHVIPEARLDAPEGNHAVMSGNIGEHMAGLVMGIAVRPRPGDMAPVRNNTRKLSVYVQEGPPPGNAKRAMSFVISPEGTPPAPDVVRVPGDMLVLTRGVPTDVTVHNRLSEPTSIHWHGLELESWSDGVPGWSGNGPRVAPPIAPGDSFTAHLSLKRAGTFIYHTHLNDIEQITSGLYGALIVLEPGKTFDPTRDFVFVGGWDGEESLEVNPMVVNGVNEEPALELQVGETYRFRFINIAPAGNFGFQIRRGSEFAEWRPIAKDGGDLPPSQTITGRALVRLFAGETADAEFTPSEPGEYLLIAPGGQGKNHYQRAIIVR
jgi:FtsP/CotA-like multicopper oxidase with cupredoxin domain